MGAGGLQQDAPQPGSIAALEVESLTEYSSFVATARV